MNKPLNPASAHDAALARMQQFMSTSAVPSISTELLATADGELNRELNHFLFDPPSDPELLRLKLANVVGGRENEYVAVVLHPVEQI